MRNEIALADEAIEVAFQDLGYCVDISDLTFTRDTLAQFDEARAQWALPGRVSDRNDTALVVEGCRAGSEPRHDVCVIDFGTVRAVYA